MCEFVFLSLCSFCLSQISSSFLQNGFLNFWGQGGGQVRQDQGLGGHGRHLGLLGAEVSGVSRLYPREDGTPRYTFTIKVGWCYGRGFLRPLRVSLEGFWLGWGKWGRSRFSVGHEFAYGKVFFFRTMLVA